MPCLPTAPGPGGEALLLSPASRLVYLAPDVQLDLGGIGKGLAADLLLTEARTLGAASASISVGGDLACGAFLPGAAVPLLTIEGYAGRLAQTAFHERGAIATSAPGVRSFTDGRHHIIDPATGRSARSAVASVSVLAASCALAEMVATAVCVLPLPDGLALVDGLGLSCVYELATGGVRSQGTDAHPVALR